MENREQLTNPFYFRGPLNPDDPSCPSTMIWREDLLKELLEDVYKTRYFLILGPRQTGKTTLAYQLSYRLQENVRNIVCFIECGALGGATESNVVDSIYSKVFQKFIDKASEPENKGLLDCLDSIKNYPKPQTFYELYTFLDKVLINAVGLNRIILILDEIEAISQENLINVLSMFRAIFNSYHDRREDPRYCVIMVTTRNLTALDLGYGSPYNIAEIRNVRNFSPEQVREMLNKEHISIEISNAFTEKAIEYLIEESNGQPYLVQRICARAVDWYIERKIKKIDKSDIIKSILHMFEFSDRNLRIILNTVEDKDNPELESFCKDLLRGEMIPFERVLPSINRLYEAGVIKEASKERRLCDFGNKIYERLFLNRYFDDILGLKGKYLLRDATLFLRSSEIQRVILNEEIRKSIEDRISMPIKKGNEKKTLNTIIKILNELRNKGHLSYDIDIIKIGILFFGSEISEENFTEDNITEVLARLYLEIFTVEQ